MCFTTLGDLFNYPREFSTTLGDVLNYPRECSPTLGDMFNYPRVCSTTLGDLFNYPWEYSTTPGDLFNYPGGNFQLPWGIFSTTLRSIRKQLGGAWASWATRKPLQKSRCQKYCVLYYLSPRPPISPQSGEGRKHNVPIFTIEN